MGKLWGKLTEHSDSELRHARDVLERFDTPQAQDDLAAVNAEIDARKASDRESK